MRYNLSIFFLFFILSCSEKNENNDVLISDSERSKLISYLGDFPEKPKLIVDTIEKVKLSKGWRYKVRYLSEPANMIFNEPEDWIEAYLFVPKHDKRDKLPAAIAVHQDGSRSDLGKLQTAGIKGQKDQAYGLELFRKGYIVICPDRFYHAKRRPLYTSNPSKIDNILQMQHQEAQLLLEGRTMMGKEVYDHSIALDILCSTNLVDTSKILAIGHSAGANIVYFLMFYDQRITHGVASCPEIGRINMYKNTYQKNEWNYNIIPSFAKTKGEKEYINYIMPRKLLISSGKWEGGKETPLQQQLSKEAIKEVQEIKRYVDHKNLSLIIFKDHGGRHGVSDSIYYWINKQL